MLQELNQDMGVEAEGTEYVSENLAEGMSEEELGKIGREAIEGFD